MESVNPSRPYSQIAGALMLDFERRYTNIYLTSTVGTSQTAQGSAETQ